MTAVESAAEAFATLTCRLPHVLVCDIGMPQNGLSFIRRVRADSRPEIASVPAMAVTAYARDQDRLRTLEAGYQFHLPKPFTATQLIEAVGLLARRKSAAPLP